MAKFRLENFVIFMTGKGVFPQLSKGFIIDNIRCLSRDVLMDVSCDLGRVLSEYSMCCLDQSLVSCTEAECRRDLH